MDDRLKFFSLWTDDTYKDLRELVSDGIDDEYTREDVACTKYFCGKCDRHYSVGHCMLELAMNPLRYMHEGEIIVCNECISPDYKQRFLWTKRIKGVYSARVASVLIAGPFNFVYNAKHDYYIDVTQDIQMSGGNSFHSIPSDIELRELYPEKCDPYYQIDSTLFDIMMRHINGISESVS